MILIGALLSTLTWSNPVELPVLVEKFSSAYGQYTTIAQVPPGSTTYVDSNNTAGRTSCYRIAYLTPNGIGPYASPGPLCKTFPKRGRK